MIAPDTDTLAGLLTECTPGPWKAEEKTGPAADWERANIGIWSPHRLAQSTAADEDDDPMNAAWLCGIWGKIEDEDMANARLIALAPELAAEVIALRAQAAEVQRCHERLEITHFWRMKPGAKDLEDLERVEVQMDERASMPDAITCRDASIALLEERIEELTTARDMMGDKWAAAQERAQTAEAGEDALAEALRSYRADLCEGFCLEAEWSDEAHNHPAMQRDCGGCLAAAALAAYEARRKG